MASYGCVSVVVVYLSASHNTRPQNEEWQKVAVGIWGVGSGGLVLICYLYSAIVLCYVIRNNYDRPPLPLVEGVCITVLYTLNEGWGDRA